MDQAQLISVLPPIHRIRWVTPTTLDSSKIVLSEPIQSSGSSGSTGNNIPIYKVLYNYSDNFPPSDLYLTVHRNPHEYMVFRGARFEKSKYDSKKRACAFELDHENSAHRLLYDTIMEIDNKVSSLTTSKSLEEVSPFGVTQISDSLSLMYARLIESGDSRVYSSAYTKDEQLDILSIQGGLVRPAFMFSITKTAKDKYSKLKIQLAQMYVHELVKEFPLAMRD